MAKERRFAHVFVREHKPAFDIYHDGQNAVLRSIGVSRDQMLLLVDGNNMAVAGHAPVAGLNELAEPFHELVFQRIMEANKDVTHRP